MKVAIGDEVMIVKTASYIDGRMGEVVGLYAEQIHPDVNFGIVLLDDPPLPDGATALVMISSCLEKV